MPDNRFQGKPVSDEWDIILTDAAKRVTFRLNSGRRSLAAQWALWQAYQAGGTLAAYPTPNAPHIMVGRPNHSLDIDQFVGDGENALQRELNRMGLVMVNDVAGEGWHMTEKDASRLRRVAARVEMQHAEIAKYPALRKGIINRDAVRRLQRLLRGANVHGTPLNGKYDLATRIAVKRFQRKHGIPTDPRATVGPRTWAALRKVNS